MVADQQYQDRYNALNRWLHGSVAIGVIGLTGLGVWMTGAQVWHWYPIHKTSGILLLLLIVARIGWRLKVGWPAAVFAIPRWQYRLKRLVQLCLLLGTLLMPLTGMLYSGASGHGFQLDNWVLWPAQYAADGSVIPYSDFWSDVGQTAHHQLGYLLIGLILIHLLAAIRQWWLISARRRQPRPA